MPSNGYYTPSDLVLIEPSLGWPSGYGKPRLKRNHDAMVELMRRRFGTPGNVNEIYRDMARQVYYRNLYLSGRGNPAAIPGTSKHGTGDAEDWNYPMNSWVSAMQIFWIMNEDACGYSSTQGRADGEPWHKVSVAEPAASVIAGGGATPLPTPTPTTPTEEEDMWIVGIKKANSVGHDGGKVFSIGKEFIRHEVPTGDWPGPPDEGGKPGAPYAGGFSTRVFTANDQVIWCDQKTQFNALLADLGIPAHAIAGISEGGAAGSYWSAATQLAFDLGKAKSPYVKLTY